MIDERKNVQQPPPVLLQARWALALLLSSLVGCPSTGSLPSTMAPPNGPMFDIEPYFKAWNGMDEIILTSIYNLLTEPGWYSQRKELAPSEGASSFL